MRYSGILWPVPPRASRPTDFLAHDNSGLHLRDRFGLNLPGAPNPVRVPATCCSDPRFRSELGPNQDCRSDIANVSARAGIEPD